MAPNPSLNRRSRQNCGTLLANGKGRSNRAIAEALGVTKAEVTTWTKRGIDHALDPVMVRLADVHRRGRPDTITPKQRQGDWPDSGTP